MLILILTNLKNYLVLNLDIRGFSLEKRLKLVRNFSYRYEYVRTNNKC